MPFGLVSPALRPAAHVQWGRTQTASVLVLQEAVQAVEGVLVHWADDNLPALPAQVMAAPSPLGDDSLEAV